MLTVSGWLTGLSTGGHVNRRPSATVRRLLGVGTNHLALRVGAIKERITHGRLQSTQRQLYGLVDCFQSALGGTLSGSEISEESLTIVGRVMQGDACKGKRENEAMRRFMCIPHENVLLRRSLIPKYEVR